ncbi:thioredoxin-disulfide reductase [Prochlorococcus sp. MIT 1300]|uniref:thioredoxin-disulfide reductase n=1 Tax=Prochlorococcus sp. MIT 1300 TaxID=3096218 RepID=UPI002A748D1C|nr:thioredoxin-disulfide reductase [Prochlorococcus sp. MIT 1300]
MGEIITPRALPIENIVIVGSGPAGYTAAIYAARSNLQPLLITGFKRGGIPGGQLMTTTHVENFPGFPDGVMGPELMDLMKAQAIRWGTQLLEADVDEINLIEKPFRLITLEKTITTHALILATGAKANRLGLPQENLFWSKGISACAICDGATPQFRQEQLAVVGGGDSACEEAIHLTKYGSHVHLLVRSNQLKASAAMADRVASNKQIKIHWETKILDVYGDEWLKGIKVISIKTNQEKNIEVKGLFYAIGHTPNTELVLNQLDCTSNGYLKTNPGRPETSVEGVFAAGDIADAEWRQGITAAGSGCKAALAAERWLSKKNLSKPIQRDPIEPPSIDKSTPISTTTKENYDENALWQKGNFALRKLYHADNKPLLVIYTSPHCGPCHVLKPQLKRVLEELEGKVQGVEIDIEADPEIAKQAGINGTPTVHLFQSKVLKAQWLGFKQRSEFKQVIESTLEINK